MWALLGQIFASGAVILDKAVLDRTPRTAADVAALGGVLSAGTSLILFCSGGVPSLDPAFLISALGGGVLLFAYLPPYFAALRGSTPDRVIAWFQLTPLLAAGTAAIALGQQLTAFQWAGAACLVCGGAAAEILAGGGIHLERRRSAALVVSAATIFALAEVLIANASLHGHGFRILIATSGVGTAGAALAYWLVSSREQPILASLRQVGMGRLALAEGLNLLFLLAHQRALGLASVGLVSATAGIQPLVIVSMLVLIRQVPPLHGGHSGRVRTALAYGLIAVGVALLSFASGEHTVVSEPA